MALWARRRKHSRTKWGCFIAILAIFPLAGCGNNGDTGKPAAANPNAPAASAPQEANQETKVVPVALDQSFLEATLQEPPGDEQLPPLTTKTGKSVGKLYETIVGKWGKGRNKQSGLWDQVKFISATGKKIHYTATIKTSAGAMEMELWPDIAPNQVRNFVALARAGYYDGLSFDRAVQQQLASSAENFVQYVEAGCPKGTGQAGYGSIGYWMKPEFSKARHEPGSVGAWHEQFEVETAGCKFYITLNRADGLDGQYTIFGKITQGLEVVRKIYDNPKAAGSVDGRLENSVVIEQVVIDAAEK